MAEDAFPENLWQQAGLPSSEGVMARAWELLERIEAYHGMPRDAGLLQAFCAGALPDGRVLVYGAGTHTTLLLDLLRARPGIRIVGILDRLADSLGSFAGYPVLLPAEAGNAAYDYIIAAHTSYEMEMRETLRALGVPESRIVPVYAHPAYHLLAAGLVQDLASQGGDCLDGLIVTCSKTVVVPDETLASLLPQRTLMAFVGRVDGFYESNVFPTIDLRESLAALRQLIDRTRPKIVYVRSIIYKNFLAMAIKLWFPHITVIHELYDYCTVWPDGDLQSLFGLDQSTIALLRTAEFFGGHAMDLNISKRGGPYWDRVLSHCSAPYQLFFPQVESPRTAAVAQGETATLLYAGFLPSPTFLRHFHNGYAFMPLIQEICRQGGMTAEIFNSAHVEAEGDRIFADYLRDYPDFPVRYSRRLPYGELLERVGNYRFGWLCDPPHDFLADRYVGVCNRWTGYISGGLPVLLDASWRFMGDFVRRFDAGLVIDDLKPETILHAIQQADMVRLRHGVAALRNHLLDHNGRAAAELARVVETGLRNDGQRLPG